MNTKNTRSTLLNHCFPPFYACYLLKSIRTPKSTATYIGSTPSPPRRIRQHNGEITQGAWKTKHNRPWVMQMVVHGFPSKLAALQFEWAWQHPWKSRHLRDEGKQKFERSARLNYLRQRINVAHGMLRSHPYNTWPLHVKLFTEDASKIWHELSRRMPLPPGCTSSLELEGVDGKSGKSGSGRIGPIDVKDMHFTTSHVQKAQGLVPPHVCAICKETIHDFLTNTLDTALCPAPACTSLAHLSCLAKHFTSSSAASTTSSASPLIPRGGSCPSCRTYILWGDVVRGAYRLSKGIEGTIEASEEEEDADAEDASMDVDTDGGPEEDAAEAVPPTRSRAKGKEKAIARPRARKNAAATKRKRRTPPADEEEGEFFDLSNVSSGSSSEPQASSPKRRGRPRKSASASPPLPPTLPVRKPSPSPPPSPRTKKSTQRTSPEEFEFCDLKSEDEKLSDALSNLSISSPGLSELEDELLNKQKQSPPKKRGRPRKVYIEISD